MTIEINPIPTGKLGVDPEGVLSKQSERIAL